MIFHSDVTQPLHDLFGVLPQIEQGMENDSALLHDIEETEVTFENKHPPDIPAINDRADFRKDLEQLD